MSPRELVEWEILGGPRDGEKLRAPRDVWRWTMPPPRPLTEPGTGRPLYEQYEVAGWIGGAVVMKYKGIG